jgi:hypothetical protein
METTRTYQGLKEGHYHFTVSSTPTKRKVGEKQLTQYAFEFFCQEAGTLETFRFMPWEIEGLLKGLGFKENAQGDYEWDMASCEGKQIEADVIKVASKKEPHKKYSRLTNISEAVPF